MKETHEEKHEIAPGTASRSDVLNETPEEKEERIQKDIDAGLRAPPPEVIDQTKSNVTPQQVQAMADAAPQPHHGDENGDDSNGKKSHAKKNTHKK